MNSEAKRPFGRLYGIGLGPGDPELVTVKASRLLGSLPHIFTPKADAGGISVARSIATIHAGPNVQFHELVYPMTRKAEVLKEHWEHAATEVLTVLATGEDAGFITLGDPMLYSTCTYLVRAVRERAPTVEIEIVPGVTSFCASAALTEFALGEQDSKLLIAPAPNHLDDLKALTHLGGRLVLMKVGSKLPQLVEWLRLLGLGHRARLVSRAGLAGQRVLSDFDTGTELEAVGYLSTLLVDLDVGREA